MYASIDETKDVIQPNTDESQFFSAKDTKQYYDYQNIIKCETKIPYNEPYETKLRTIPNVIYPEYKKGRKSIHELANYYQIEAYLIEEYIEREEGKSIHDLANHYQKKANIIEEYIEKKEGPQYKNEKCKDVKKNDSQDSFVAKLTSLENKMDILEEKIDHIIDVIAK